MMKNGLCEHIEVALGRKMNTPKDFDFLRECVFSRLNVWVSTTTLKRIWGYLKDDVQPRQGTFDILARFIGFEGYENFLHSMAEGVVLQSSPVMSRRISVQDDLKEGDRLRLFGNPIVSVNCFIWGIWILRYCVLPIQGYKPRILSNVVLSLKGNHFIWTTLCKVGNRQRCTFVVRSRASDTNGWKVILQNRSKQYSV